MSELDIIPFKVNITDKQLQTRLLQFARPLYERVQDGTLDMKTYKESVLLMVQILTTEKLNVK
jgi:hypothetical protein